MKLALLHTRLSGYLAACLKEFKQQTDAELLIYAWPNQPNAPFDKLVFGELGKCYNRHNFSDKSIFAAVEQFCPTAVIVSGWKDKGYVSICQHLKSYEYPVIAGCDTQWRGSLRQQLAALAAPVYVQKFIDVLWVTGERQRYFARTLGYSGNRCWDGYYACDWASFANPLTDPITSSSPYFLYVGRYAPEKGLDTLAAAYGSYASQVKNPWRLVCAGAGPLQEVLLAAGAEDRGFVQPQNLPALMRNASAFVLPSRFEPWGVVAQEAAASSLPLILSDACGSGVHLLRPYFNGFVFPAGSSNRLAKALLDMHHLEPERRFNYGRASYNLSKQYTPERWAETLCRGIASLST
jgi:glycosyltransferase involved in cell wall biosynthesis